MSANQDTLRYGEMFDYLSDPLPPTEPEPAVVFGRNDPLVARAAGELAAANLAEVIVISGGVGKDTGALIAQGYRSEAHFLGDGLTIFSYMSDVELPEVILEERATSGRENAEFTVRLLEHAGFGINSLTAAAHGTSLRRLAGQLLQASQAAGAQAATVHRVPSKYEFDPASPIDQREAALELLRLDEWEQYGELRRPADIPANLLDFARDIYKHAPKPPSRLKSAVFRALPRKLQVAIAARLA